LEGSKSLKNICASLFAGVLLALTVSCPSTAEEPGDSSALGQALRIARDNNAQESLASVHPANCTLDTILASFSNEEEGPIRKDLESARDQYKTAATKLTEASKQKSSQAKLNNWPQGEYQGTKLITKADVLRLMADKANDSKIVLDNLLNGELLTSCGASYGMRAI
jgi:hypothetical protein